MELMFSPKAFRKLIFEPFLESDYLSLEEDIENWFIVMCSDMLGEFLYVSVSDDEVKIDPYSPTPYFITTPNDGGLGSFIADMWYNWYPLKERLENYYTNLEK